MLEDRVQDGVRHLTLQVRSARGAAELLLPAGPGPSLLEASVNGRVVLQGQQTAASLPLRYEQPPAGGVRIALKLGTGAPLTFQVTDHTYGLPPALAPQVPPDWMPRGSYYNNSTFVTRVYKY